MGRQDPLAEALRSHETQVASYLRRMGADRDAVADLTQETFLRAIRGAHRWRGGSTTAWLLGIARNVHREWVRGQIAGRRTVSAVAADPSTAAVGPPADADDLDLAALLQRLDEDDREVLVLRYVLDLPGEDVAALLGVGHDALRQRVARAKQRLHEALETSDVRI